MKELSPHARELLAEYRRASAPSELTSQRAARALSQRLARGELGASEIDVAPPQLPHHAPAARMAPTGAGLTAVVVGVGITMLIALGLPRDRPASEPVAPVAAPAAAPVEQAEQVEQVEQAEQVVQGERVEQVEPARAPRPTQHAVLAAAPRAASLSVAERARVGTRRPMAQQRVLAPELAPAPAPALAPAPTPEPAPAPEDTVEIRDQQDTPAPVDEEVALLRAAHTSLRAGDPQRALASLAEHRWRFPKGQLADSRDVARMLALCAMGSAATARAEAARFLAARPRSPFAARVRDVCPPRSSGVEADGKADRKGEHDARFE